MAYFKICPWCSAALDPGEICDCEGAHPPITETSIECPSGNSHRDNHAKKHIYKNELYWKEYYK